MKCFNIPGPQTHFTLNMYLLNQKEIHPEFFYPDIKISSIFGNFQYCIWDGGRNFSYYEQMTEEKMLLIKKNYDHFQIPIRFVFTNPIIKKEHLDDRFCNLCLELFHEEKNEIVINSPLMEDYLMTNYPKYKLISSTTKRLTNPDDFLKELENPNYYQVCLDYDLNKNKELINSIPKELRAKCEFLINAICPAHCPQRKEHYAKTGQAYLTYLKDKYNNDKCGITYPTIHPAILGKGNNFTLEELNQYNKLGYKYFKMEGRTLTSFEMLLAYTYYMIKPEWQYYFLLEAYIQQAFINTHNDLYFYELKEKPDFNIGL